jgi:hypothetical protein
MHTSHSSNRKPKSNSGISSMKIEGLSKEDWDDVLKDSCPEPNSRGITPAILEFVKYARGKKYSYPQIAAACKKKFKLNFTASAYSEAVRRAEQKAAA